MSGKTTFTIAVLAGDGIGPEVIASTIPLLEQAVATSPGFALEMVDLPAGAMHYRDHGEALPATTLEACRAADAILLGAMGWPELRYPDGTEIAPQLDLRTELGLFAGVRPIRTLPGVAPTLADPRAAHIDFVLVRESVEGLFALRHEGRVVADSEARDTMVVTRKGSEDVFEFAFDLARQRRHGGHRGLLTLVDKANVFASLAFFRKVFDEVHARHPDIEADHAYVDATALALVKRPWSLDVLVTENMFGDILSDLGAGLMGGMGFAPSADIGHGHAVFQPCHGSAPDIAGEGKANPTAAILSGAMMLEWLAHRHGCPPAAEAGRVLRAAVDEAFRRGLSPFELGGADGTQTIATAISRAMAAAARQAV